MDNKEIEKKSVAELAEGFKKDLDKSMDELAKGIEGKASADELEALKKQVEEDKSTYAKKLEASIEENKLAIKKLSKEEYEEFATKKTQTIEKSLIEKKDDISKLGHGVNKVIFKAPATMLESTNIIGGGVPLEQRLPGFDRIASRQIRLFDFVSRGTATSNVISWVSQINQDGAAGGTAEGAVKNQIDFDLQRFSESLKKFTAFIKVSDEMKEDIPFLNTEINNELRQEILKVVEAQIFAGDNTALQLNGIKTQASAFTPGSFATGQPNAVDNPNEVDVLRVAMNQIFIANQTFPTAAFVHPTTITKLLTIKNSTTDRRYIDQLQMIGGTMFLDGVPLVRSTMVTEGEYVIGDYSKATVYDMGDIQIEMGLDADDFTKNLMTVRAEWRGLNIIKTNQTSAFVGGDFAVDIPAINV